MAAIRKMMWAALLAGGLGVLPGVALADPVTFSTTGVFSISGTNVVNFTSVNGTTTLTFNGTTDPVNTPVGASFGDLVVSTTVPANLPGPAVGGNFTLNIIQVSPAGVSSFAGTLPGTLGFNTGVATITFATTSIPIGGFTYTIEPIYTIALPVTGVGGGSGTGTTTLQGTVTGTAVLPPSIAKAFGAPTIPLNGTTSLTFTLNNANAATALSAVAFTDSLPAGLVVASASGVTSTCGGAVTAVAGNSIVDFSGGTIAAASSCTVTVNVQGMTAGSQVNTTGAIASAEGGTGNTASATLVVVAPPALTKAFGTGTMALNGTTSLTLTLANPNAATALTGVAVTDALPAGLVVATPSGLASTCGGTATADAGSTSVTLTGGTLAAGGSCTVVVTVAAVAGGVQVNTTSAPSSVEGGAGIAASSTVVVAAPPSLAKAFGTQTLFIGQTTSLTFTITNPNPATALTGIAFTDTLPNTLGVANPNDLSGNCNGSIVAGGNTISLSGASLAGGTSCSFSVTVVARALGVAQNTTSAVTSTEGGTGPAASASLSVVQLVPTLSTWVLALLALMLAATAALLARRRALD
jgi:uncharacterized repeat protein (TIGR01451 family)